jgi:hypothetical protein
VQANDFADLSDARVAIYPLEVRVAGKSRQGGCQAAIVIARERSDEAISFDGANL